ncbi:hypothetical protein [Pseudoflavonifractor sp. BSD2780061688st1 E11]|uniref:hypothetical protein n=1 Tax=Oscillospiraceae TaxID=216572 RepID=UPI00325B1571
MTKYREILRLKSLGFSERNIAHSCGVSRNTVAKVVKRAVEMNLSWPLDHDMTDSALEEMLFPKVKSATNRRMPDYDYIRRELLHNGVNKKLLWVEYCEEYLHVQYYCYPTTQFHSADVSVAAHEK